jgi:uncharacterized membrane protein YbaN (DUF454 family)
VTIGVLPAMIPEDWQRIGTDFDSDLWYGTRHNEAEKEAESLNDGRNAMWESRTNPRLEADLPVYEGGNDKPSEAHLCNRRSTDAAMEIPEDTRSQDRRLQRWLLAGLGIVMVGVGGVGVFLPGLPTTVFLLGASWCFARSCPWLEERLIRVPLFRPFLGYLDNGAAMPRSAVVTTLVIMWIAIAASVVSVNLGADTRPVLGSLIIALGLVGSFFVLRIGRRQRSQAAEVRGTPDPKT